MDCFSKVRCKLYKLNGMSLRLSSVVSNGLSSQAPTTLFAMTPTRKKNIDALGHLSTAQLEALESEAWNFLLRAVGGEQQTRTAKKNHIKDHAEDFVLSEEGELFWPLTPERLWSFEYPKEYAFSCITEILWAKCKKRDAVTRRNDDNATSSESCVHVRKSSTPNSSGFLAINTPVQDATSHPPSPAVSIASSHTITALEENPHDCTTSAHETSPRPIVDRAISTSEHDLLDTLEVPEYTDPTSSDQVIREGTFDDAQASAQLHAGIKRPHEVFLEEAGPSTARATKRPRAMPSTPIDNEQPYASPGPVEHSVRDASFPSTQHPSPPPTATIAATVTSTTPTTIPNPNDTLITSTNGLRFHPTNLALLPDLTSAYILACRNKCNSLLHAIDRRSSTVGTTPQQGYQRERLVLMFGIYHDLFCDIETRIVSLSVGVDAGIGEAIQGRGGGVGITNFALEDIDRCSSGGVGGGGGL